MFNLPLDLSNNDANSGEHLTLIRASEYMEKLEVDPSDACILLETLLEHSDLCHWSDEQLEGWISSELSCLTCTT